MFLSVKHKINKIINHVFLLQPRTVDGEEEQAMNWSLISQCYQHGNLYSACTLLKMQFLIVIAESEAIHLQQFISYR